MTLKQKIENLVSELIKLNATDIHFQPLETETKIYYRQSGKLFEYSTMSLNEYIHLINYIKYASNLNISEIKKPQDGTIELELKDQSINIRISTIPLLKNESLVLRIIPAKIEYQAKDLVWEVEKYQKIKKIIQKSLGLFIFTGPTGSGKTTFMYHVLKDLVITKQAKVITIENPIEINSEYFVQMQINDQQLNYDVALKSVLRQDPDIIMIGEIRDLSTAQAVMRAALTGHTIITTMHTKNKFGVVERFRDFGFSDSEIGSVLSGVCNQRLININDKSKIYIDYIDLGTNSCEWGENESSIEAEISLFKQRY